MNSMNCHTANTHSAKCLGGHPSTDVETISIMEYISIHNNIDAKTRISHQCTFNTDSLVSFGLCIEMSNFNVCKFLVIGDWSGP